MAKDYLLDTTIVSWFMKLKSGVVHERCGHLHKNLIEKRKTSSKIHLCAPTIGEIRRGALIAPKDNMVMDINEVMKSFSQVFEINMIVARDYYAVLWARLAKRYEFTNLRPSSEDKRSLWERIDDVATWEMRVGENDLWIASVAMCYNLILVTSDGMDIIKSISGTDIEFEDWTKP